MRRYAVLSLVASLATALEAAPRRPCPPRGDPAERPVLMRFAPLGVAQPLSIPGRGELADWNALAGAWDGVGTDGGGAFSMKAGLEPLFGGQFVLIRTTEQRGDQVLREQLEVWTAGETPGVYLYDSRAPFRRLTGSVDSEGASLTAGDARSRLTWRRSAEGLTGTREEADASGAFIAVATWALKSGTAASLEERRRGVVGPVNDLKGELRGEGETAITPGQAAGAHFQAEESGVVALDGAIVTTRQTHRYDAGRTEAAFLVHGVENDRPFRHAFLERGRVVAFTGEFVGVDQMVFSNPVPEGDLKVTFVHT